MITKSINKAKGALLNGEVVAIPTETVYGLAAVIWNDRAIRRIFEIKNRPFFDPLIVHISRWEELADVVVSFSKLERHLAEKFWPGALTIVSRKSDKVSSLITSGHETVAVRMPNHLMTLELLRAVQAPVAAPSANQFGHTSPTTAGHVVEEFPNGDVLILDGGAADIGIESTVIQCSDAEVKILRPGGVSREQLEKAVIDGLFNAKVVRAESEISPGHLKHHYQPRKPLIVYQGEILPEGIDKEIISLPSDAKIAARELYSALRLADRSDSKKITLHWPYSTEGEWEGIWDRVKKAASEIHS